MPKELDGAPPLTVALRKESVDRNEIRIAPIDGIVESLSARRAWIEISTRSQPRRPKRVALRKESVDRNLNAVQIVVVIVQSLSARRAWIEISGVDFAEDWLNVALRKESVDRNSLLCRILFRR